MAITLTEGTCLQVPDLDEWQLLGRVPMRNDWPSELKINVVAYHRHTGRLARFYMIRPQHPDGLDALDYSSDPDDLPGYAAWKQQWDQENAAARYETDKPLWDLVSRLPEITDVFIGTVKDLHNSNEKNA
ncbi:hypothetical protein JF732_26765 [Mycobacterium intracellulare]|nr:hypothetical protein [Mycobacterium intracellulare]